MTTRKEWQEDKVVIYVTKDTRKRMESVGKMNESSNQLINRLIDSHLELIRSKSNAANLDLVNIFGPDVLRKKQKISLSDKQKVEEEED